MMPLSLALSVCVCVYVWVHIWTTCNLYVCYVCICGEEGQSAVPFSSASVPKQKADNNDSVHQNNPLEVTSGFISGCHVG